MPLHGSKWSIFASLLICAVCAPCPAQNSGSMKVNEGETRLSFPGDHFHLALSITNGTAPASAQVSAELLDTDDSVRSAATGACDFTTGTTVCQIEMPPAIPHSKHGSNDGDWLPLFRLRYTSCSAWRPPGFRYHRTESHRTGPFRPACSCSKEHSSGHNLHGSCPRSASSDPQAPEPMCRSM